MSKWIDSLAKPTHPIWSVLTICAGAGGAATVLYFITSKWDGEFAVLIATALTPSIVEFMRRRAINANVANVDEISEENKRLKAQIDRLTAKFPGEDPWEG